MNTLPDLKLNPAIIELGLTRVLEVFKHIHPSLKFNCPVITVAGTNGKGSTVAALSMIAQQAGLRVGTYTSPHLFHFNERIQINDQPISDEDLSNAMDVVEKARTSLRAEGEAIQNPISLTYFEFTTLTAFVHFLREKPDILVLEVGMGGRLDAVNIIDADVAVITQIAKDHTQWLGDTLEKIALEKAGIMRCGKPVVIGNTLMFDVLSMEALRVDARVFQPDVVLEKSHLHPNSLGCALKAAELLNIQIDKNKIIPLLQSLTLQGRYQKNTVNGCLHISDVAHNYNAMENLALQLRRENYNELHIVMGMLADKDIESSVKPLHDLNPRYYCVSTDGDRGLSSCDLMSRMNYDGFIECFETVIDARNKAMSNMRKGDVLLTTGSFHIVGSP